MSSVSPISSPVGELWLQFVAGALVGLSWQAQPQNRQEQLLLPLTTEWLNAYFHGDPTPFPSKKIPLKPQGTPFQQKIWQRLLQIPHGQTITYGDIAKDLNTAPRAVGQAVAANPIPIIIPCHRVLASGGFGGYSGLGGIESKKILLNLEANS